jgi:hypothetical protein
MHLTQLARMFQSEVKPVNLNGNIHRMISVPVAKFLEFISPAISLDPNSSGQGDPDC